MLLFILLMYRTWGVRTKVLSAVLVRDKIIWK
jgi:hypothetical protein